MGARYRDSRGSGALRRLFLAARSRASVLLCLCAMFRPLSWLRFFFSSFFFCHLLSTVALVLTHRYADRVKEKKDSGPGETGLVAGAGGGGAASRPGAPPIAPSILAAEGGKRRASDRHSPLTLSGAPSGML